MIKEFLEKIKMEAIKVYQNIDQSYQFEVDIENLIKFTHDFFITNKEEYFEYCFDIVDAISNNPRFLARTKEIWSGDFIKIYEEKKYMKFTNQYARGLIGILIKFNYFEDIISEILTAIGNKELIKLNLLTWNLEIIDFKDSIK